MGAGNFKATINGRKVTRTEGTGIFINPASDYITYKYNVVEISSDDGTATVIIMNPNKQEKTKWTKFIFYKCFRRIAADRMEGGNTYYRREHINKAYTEDKCKKSSIYFIIPSMKN